MTDLPCDVEPNDEAAFAAAFDEKAKQINMPNRLELGCIDPGTVPTVCISLPSDEGEKIDTPAAAPPECAGTMTLVGLVAPADGKHYWSTVRGSGQQVCLYCFAHRPEPPHDPGPVRLENRHGEAIKLGPKVASMARPSDLSRNALSLKEKIAQLAGQRATPLTRAEAEAMGFPPDEIAAQWPDP